MTHQARRLDGLARHLSPSISAGASFGSVPIPFDGARAAVQRYRVICRWHPPRAF